MTIDVANLSPNERLQTMEALWEAISHDKKEPNSPEWHEPILEERMKEVNSGEAKFYSLDEVKSYFSSNA